MKTILMTIGVAAASAWGGDILAAEKEASAGMPTPLEARGVVVDGRAVQEVERREFADGVAVRYILPPGARRIESEETVWRLPEDATVWYQPGGGKFGIDYEASYAKGRVGDLGEGQLMAMPVTANA